MDSHQGSLHVLSQRYHECNAEGFLKVNAVFYRAITQKAYQDNDEQERKQIRIHLQKFRLISNEKKCKLDLNRIQG